MDKKDLLLMAVSAGQGTGLTPVQLQKVLFLIGESKLQGLPTVYYEFEPYNYGPFQVGVYLDADDLTLEGYVAEIPVAGKSWSAYSITPAGKERAQQAELEAGPVLAGYIKALVQWAKSLSFSELLRAIYAQYPDFRKNSVFQG